MVAPSQFDSRLRRFFAAGHHKTLLVWIVVLSVIAVGVWSEYKSKPVHEMHESIGDLLERFDRMSKDEIKAELEHLHDLTAPPPPEPPESP